MTYIPSLHKIQYGVEAAYGDGAAGTIQPPGIMNVRVDPKVEGEQLKDLRGTTMPSHEALVKRRWSEVLIEGYLNYQEAYLYLDGMFGYDAPAAGVYDYKASLDWSPEVEKSRSLRYGQTGLIYLVPGLLPYVLTLSGASGEVVKFSEKSFGHPSEDGASFASLSDDVVEWAQCTGTGSLLYLDDGRSAAPGTTPMTELGFRWQAVINANRKPVWHIGDQEHDTWRNGKWGDSLKLVLEADATLLAHVGNIIDATVTPKTYAVRIRTTDAANALDIDFVGDVITPPRLIPDADGIVTVELDLVPSYGSHANMLSCWDVKLTVAP